MCIRDRFKTFLDDIKDMPLDAMDIPDLSGMLSYVYPKLNMNPDTESDDEILRSALTGIITSSHPEYKMCIRDRSRAISALINCIDKSFIASLSGYVVGFTSAIVLAIEIGRAHV